jgi:hypothetical protein
MSFKICSKRQQTMLARIGEAADLIDDKRFLPFYRSVQIKLEKMDKADEWGRMIEAAKAKANPSKYFASICKMVRDGTYKFTEKLKELAGETALFITDKIVHFGFGQYQKYWVRRADAFIKANSMAAFIELLEYSKRKGVSQQYFAKALMNGKPPREFYKLNIAGVK